MTRSIDKFSKSPRITVPDGCGVVTAADSKTFTGAQLLYHSVALSHAVPFLLIDAGISAKQRDWCCHNGLKVRVLKNDEQIFSQEQEWREWNRPSYLLTSPFRKTLWLDPGCVVTGDLNEIFKIIAEEPFWVSSNAKPLPDEWYQGKPVKRANHAVDRAIIGMDIQRESRVIELWHKTVHTVYARQAWRHFLENDRGALQWSIEAAGLGDRIIPNSNLVKSVQLRQSCECPKDVLDLIQMKSVIQKFETIPWSHWTDGHDFSFDTTRNKILDRLRVFVMGYTEIQEPWLTSIDLDTLIIGEHQTPKLGTNRFFLSNIFEIDRHEYVGVAPADWNQRFVPLGTVDLQNLHHLVHLLDDEDVVIVGRRTDNANHWKIHYERDNPGIMPYLDDIELLMGRSCAPSLLDNAFICHRTVYREFLAEWRRVYNAIFNKYKNIYGFVSADPSRSPSFIGEAITTAFFASRPQLRLVEANRNSV